MDGHVLSATQKEQLAMKRLEHKEEVRAKGTLIVAISDLILTIQPSQADSAFITNAAAMLGILQYLHWLR